MASDVVQATKHQTLSFPTGVLEPAPIGLFVNASGTADIVMADQTCKNTVSITYNLTVGAMLPIRPQQVTGGSATLVAVY